MDKELKNMFEQFNKKLEVISALLLKLVPRNGNEIISLRDQIKILDGLGLRPVDVAKITGKTQSHINKELVTIRKEK